ncbi:MAG: sigma-70 family RNA polymerase sigma factor [Chloroflexi bacterium]|nr:sigma-70 family RNA polymerase sigma factor [Chloroflexota bacterium]
MEEEQHLVQGSRQGDLQAFNQLVERYQGQVYNLALRMLGQEDDAADATQEAFLSAYRAMGGFRGGDFRSWLLRIAANACRDQVRRAKARPALSLDAITTLDPGAGPPSLQESPEEHVLRAELAREVQQCLALLPEDQRMTVVLVDVQGLSYEEAATVTRASLGTVKSRLSRGRAAMRDLLQRQPELLPRQFRLHRE